MITLQPDCIIELTVITLDGKRLIVRGILDSPIRLRSSVVDVQALPTTPESPTPPRRRIEGE